MTLHIHGVLDKLSQHLPQKCARRATATHTQSGSNTAEHEKTPQQPSLTPSPSPSPSDFRPNDKYTHLKDLDSGEEGQCTVVKSHSTGRIYVRKRIRPPPAPPRHRPAHPTPPQATGRRKSLPPEARILTQLQPHHANLIRYFGVEPSPRVPEGFDIYLEFCSGGDLLDQLRTFRSHSTHPGPSAPVVFTLHVLVSLAQALAYLHHGLRHVAGTMYAEQKGHQAVIHGDIKPDNVFLRHTPHPQVAGLPDIVLADFGMSQLDSLSRGITGTPGYDSPEVRAVASLRQTDPALYERKSGERVMTTASDMYQLGLIMYLMSTGRHWKVGADPAGIELESEEYKAVTGFVALMVWCLQPEARERPECTDSLEEGCLFAVDVLRRRRDLLVELGVAEGLKGLWHKIELCR